MNDLQSLSPQLQSLVAQVEILAAEHDQDYGHLLELLRVLEALHRRVRTDYFEPSLPNTRRGLYGLLRDIQESGGWPYIERGKLAKFIELLEVHDEKQDGQTTSEEQETM